MAKWHGCSVQLLRRYQSSRATKLSPFYYWSITVLKAFKSPLNWYNNGKKSTIRLIVNVPWKCEHHGWLLLLYVWCWHTLPSEAVSGLLMNFLQLLGDARSSSATVGWNCGIDKWGLKAVSIMEAIQLSESGVVEEARVEFGSTDYNCMKNRHCKQVRKGQTVFTCCYLARKISWVSL